MMKKELYNSKSILTEDKKDELLVEYYLLTSNHPVNTDFEYLSYGAEIRLKHLNCKNYSEIESFEEIFLDEKTALVFLETLYKGSVTPCTLKDIVSDVLTEKLV